VKKPRVLLADDHQIVVAGLKGILEPEFELAGVVANGRAMVDQAISLRPDVVVADITMPQLNGIDALSMLRKASVDIPVVFLTMHNDISYARSALDAGAAGFVLKHAAPEELVQAVRAALQGGTYISPTLAGELFLSMRQGAERPPDPISLLTLRQRDILRLLSDGRSAKEIAKELDISARTVEFHKYKMMELLGVKSSAELIRFVINHGVV